MKIFYIFFVAVFMFGNSVSSFANRDRSDRRDRNRLESRHEKTERKSNQEARRGRSNGVSRSGGSARSGLVVATKSELPKVEKAVVEEETELKIAPIKKTTQYPNYSRDLQDIISNASSQYSKVGRNVKKYSKSSSSCIADFTECVSQTSICDKGFNKCLNSDRLELEKTTWFCQQKFLDKCHPDSHETMYERFLSDLAGFIEARRQRKLAGEAQARQIALAKQRAYDKKEIYKLACKNAGGLLTDNGDCGFRISLVYPGGNIEQTVIGEKAYCNITTMGYDPIEKKVTEQTKKRNTITAIGAGVGLVGGAIAGAEIEDNMEKKEDDLQDMLTKLLETGDGLPSTPEEKKELYKKCKEETGMREGKCIRLIKEFYEELEYEAPETVDGSKGYKDELEKCVKHAKTENECKTLLKDLDPYTYYKDEFKLALEIKVEEINLKIAKENEKIKKYNKKVNADDCDGDEDEKELKDEIAPEIDEFIDEITTTEVFELWYNSKTKTSIINKCFKKYEFQKFTCKSALRALKTKQNNSE